MPGLDDVDRRIVRQLRANARIPNAALAKSVGLSPSACLRRVKLLEDRGVIRGYQAVVAEGDEDSVVAIVLITLEKQTGDYMRRFETAVREHPEIQECYLMAGEADYVLRAAAPSIDRKSVV